ncbi:GNAT family N-acetyltransferase [Natronomonas marina]|jgi:ribosomal protein S18 acetylase RimI-like enzyme|uniref:GNAT family N-acetyltransferase n=1 Tax=Natronomonas marina TaxID=2961939 RepID=UPI0020C9FE4E|nr:GNAT family N-acetyltransferase [Natronomonas marina]
MTDVDEGEVPTLSLRAYDERDAGAVWRLHELAFRDIETDPADIPGTDDLRDVRGTYIESGGGFLVGTVPSAPPEVPRVHDGALVAMGGFLPSGAGHDDERHVEGAAELHRMRVAPACQRRGYGRRLLGALEAAVEAAGYDPVLATTARRQRAAVEFYADAGYTVVGESTAVEYELVHFEKRLG